MKSKIIDGELIVTFAKEDISPMIEVSIAGFRHAENVIGTNGAKHSYFKEWKDTATIGRKLFNTFCELKEENEYVL